MNRQVYILTILLCMFGLLLASCGKTKNENVREVKEEQVEIEQVNLDKTESHPPLSVALITYSGGVKDRSFNEFAWEGLQSWGKDFKLEEGLEGYTYVVPEKDTEEAYMQQFHTLVKNDTDLIFSAGFLLDKALRNIATKHPEKHFVSIDTVVSLPNVVSITFAENEGSFLAGVAAAMKTKTNKIGFIGGMESDVIQKFEVGYIAGIQSINKEIETTIQYVEDFNDVEKAQILAEEMYEDGIDIIYHAAGNAGNGVFTAAKKIQAEKDDDAIWVIGVDRDQYKEGQVNNSDQNVTLTSMMKRIDLAVYDVAKAFMSGSFPTGEILLFDLADEGVYLTDTNEQAFTNIIASAVNEWRKKIINEEIIVPRSRAELEDFKRTVKD